MLEAIVIFLAQLFLNHPKSSPQREVFLTEKEFFFSDESHDFQLDKMENKNRTRSFSSELISDISRG
jgi:hypothetical protein